MPLLICLSFDSNSTFGTVQPGASSDLQHLRHLLMEPPGSDQWEHHSVQSHVLGAQQHGRQRR